MRKVDLSHFDDNLLYFHFGQFLLTCFEIHKCVRYLYHPNEQSFLKKKCVECCCKRFLLMCVRGARQNMLASVSFSAGARSSTEAQQLSTDQQWRYIIKKCGITWAKPTLIFAETTGLDGLHHIWIHSHRGQQQPCSGHVNDVGREWHEFIHNRRKQPKRECEV